MKIAIIGTRGIPNHYGGFEQFAEYLSLGLANKGHDVTVYNSHQHPFQKSYFNGVNIVHCYDPESRLGTAGQFIYDLNCIIDARRRNFEIILQLGYTSSSIWGWLMPRKKSIITTNMDGLEWKRSKFSRKVQQFLKYAEKLGVKYSDYLISDSIGIQTHIKQSYQQDSLFIPYGSNLFTTPDASLLSSYEVQPFEFNMLVARLEPENSVELILQGVVFSNRRHPFLVIGNHETKFGRYLKEKFKRDERIIFAGSNYDINVLNNLRHFSNLYFHGHTVGGTNPSLLEAMGSQALIAANNNIFNSSILGNDAFYFENAEEVQALLDKSLKSENMVMIRNNEEKIRCTYSWSNIIDQYENHFKDILNRKIN